MPKIHSIPNTQTLNIAGIGEVIFTKKNNMKNIRLTIDRNGKPKVSMPIYADTKTAIDFALRQTDWISKQLKKNINAQHKIIDDSYHLSPHFKFSIIFHPYANMTIVGQDNLSFMLNQDQVISDSKVQNYLKKQILRFLLLKANEYLPSRLELLAQKYNFNYNGVVIKKLHSRWGSCSNQHEIKLSVYLMRLPKDYIDYVLIHELVHIRHFDHSQQFWAEICKYIPNYRQIRKGMKQYSTSV